MPPGDGRDGMVLPAASAPNEITSVTTLRSHHDCEASAARVLFRCGRWHPSREGGCIVLRLGPGQWPGLPAVGNGWSGLSCRRAMSAQNSSLNLHQFNLMKSVDRELWSIDHSTTEATVSSDCPELRRGMAMI
eukprot:m.155118 g.155118  ORF g.155118 m.155118 type:complete len:133 (+) comp23547_c0_seq2:3910-4308(+)